jgi:hypothetical protein
MHTKIFTAFFLFLSTMSFAQNIPSYVPKNGLVGYWPFNGNGNDESGNGNNGTVNGALSFQQVKQELIILHISSQVLLTTI